MELLEQLAEAALQHDNFRMRSLVQDMARAPLDWSLVPRPNTTDPRLLALSASLAELLASRQHQILMRELLLKLLLLMHKLLPKDQKTF